MSSIHFDTLRAAHLLARIQTEPGMRADAFFERCLTDRLVRNCGSQHDASSSGADQQRSLRHEQRLAVRLLTQNRSWFESRDELSGRAFDDALRRTARSLSSVPMPRLAISSRLSAADASEGARASASHANAIARLPRAVEAAVLERRAAFPFRLELTHHQRNIALAGPSILAEQQSENFLEFRATLTTIARNASDRTATVGGLFALDGLTGFSSIDRERIGGEIAGLLVERFRARDAPAPAEASVDLVLSPNASAILLHEAVSHALEVDILSLSGNPQDALGVELGSPLLDVLEDPSAAPESVRRTNDDEGTPTQRRWLLRQGRVTQPIADVAWSERNPTTDPGCGRRASRHDLVGPRSHFLELLTGETTQTDLLQGEGLWLDQVHSGSLQAQTGSVILVAACGRRFKNGNLADRVGPFVLRGHLADLLSSVVAVGNSSEHCGAGWCAKDGQRLPVWARAPSLRLEQVSVRTP